MSSTDCDNGLPSDTSLLEQLHAAGVRYRRLSGDEHLHWERKWRETYGVHLSARSRCRHGAKAVYECLGESTTYWLLVPFLANVPGLPVHVLSPTLSAFECDGPLLELGDFNQVEFFISPCDMAWTFVRTHEDFALGGPYFVRAEWVERSDEPASM